VLVRAVTTREPRWTEQDRAEVIALATWRAGLCPKCGQPIDVCTAHEGDPNAAVFDVVWRVCNATRRLSEFKRATYTGDNHPDREAHLLGTTIRKR
jgi:hypothetical protein